jgi:uncharacterized damage-inducible protein DinB
MTIAQNLLAELKRESVGTRKLLLSIPYDNLDWKPHPKSMAIANLAWHIAELPGWISLILHTSELDFATYKNPVVMPKNSNELLSLFDSLLEKAIEDLTNATDEMFTQNWTMKSGEIIYFANPKLDVIREWAYSHLINHRAQASVYLRLLDIKVPNLYGPTADDAQ